MDAAMRHIFQYLSGEELDEEMQLPHLAAATWELLAVQEFIKKEGSKNLFTKQDIKEMNPEEFIKNEDAIFEQLKKGLIE